MKLDRDDVEALIVAAGVGLWSLVIGLFLLGMMVQL